MSIAQYSSIGYDQTGIWLGVYDLGAGAYKPRFSLKNTAGDRYLLWTGEALEIAGNIRIKNTSTANDGGKVGSFDNGDSHNAGDVGGWELASDAIYSGTKNTSGYNPGAGITLAAAGSIHSKNFYIDTSGNAFFKGTLSAANGSFAGDISAATGTFGGTVSVGTAPNQIILGGGSLTGPGFSLTSAGLSVSNATIFGRIEANAGSIGSWTVEDNVLRDGSSRIFFDPALPGMAIKENGNTRLKVNYGELTDLSGGAINLSTQYLSEYQSPSPSVNVDIDVESTGESFSVPGGTYTDSNVAWPSVSAVIQAFNRGGSLDLYWGYRIYQSTTLIAEVVVASTYWNGGIDESFADFNGYTGNFSFSPPNAASTSYTLKTFFRCQGYTYAVGYGGGAGLDINFGVTFPSISAVANVNVVELTNKGIQIASSANRYIRLRREDSASVPLLDGKGFISLIGDTSNTIIQLSGTTGGKSIDIASGTGEIDMNANNITDVGQLSWNVANPTYTGYLTTHLDGSLRSTIQLTNIPGAGAIGGTMRGLQISLSNWKVGRDTSSRRFKEEIEDWQHPSILEAINQVPIRTFYWKVDADKDDRTQQIGVIAEELESAGLEEFVDFDWCDDPDNPEGPKKWLSSGIAKQELVFVLWKAVQELTQKVKDLESKIGS
jgi:hypothetical protein